MRTAKSIANADPIQFPDVIFGMICTYVSSMMCHAMYRIFSIIITLLPVIPTMTFVDLLLANLLAYLLTFYLAFYLEFYLAYLLAFYLAYFLAFYLAVKVQRCTLSWEGPRLSFSGAHITRRFMPGGGKPTNTDPHGGELA